MMRPTYPRIGFFLEAEEPESTVVVRRSASGRIRMHDLGGFSDHAVTLTHSLIKMPTVDEVMAFWRANRGRTFNVEDGLGEIWIGAFRARPHRIHVGGLWYDLVVQMIRYDLAEGGL